MKMSKSQIYKFNFLLLTLEGSLFMGGMGFYNTTSVIPVFIENITHSKELVGLTITLGSFFTYFGRLVVGPFVPHVKNHQKFTTIIMFICRPVLLLPAIFILLHQYQISVYVLMFSYSMLWICDGLVVPSWSEVLANTVDEDRQGRLLGLQMLIGGAAAIFAGIIINVFLSNPALNLNSAFGWIFLIGGLLVTVSCFMMLMAKNAPHEPKKGKIDFLGYYKTLPKYLILEKDNTKINLVQLILTVAGMGIPFVILFSLESLGVSKSFSAILILAQTIGSPVGGWFWGQVCDKLGCENGIKLAGVNLLLIACLPLLSLVFHGPVMLFFLILAMFLCGVNGGIWTCSYVYTVQAVRPESRAACIVLSSLIALPGSFAGYLAGFISTKWNYTVLFIVCAALALVGIIFAFRIRPIRMVVEERQKKDLEVNNQTVQPLSE